jgi:hypothetical protein
MNNILFWTGVACLCYIVWSVAGLVGLSVMTIAILAGYVAEALVYAWKMDKREG